MKLYGNMEVCSLYGSKVSIFAESEEPIPKQFVWENPSHLNDSIEKLLQCSELLLIV